MKHIIVGGDGFVGRYMSRDLLKKGENVLVCDVKQSSIPIYESAEFMHCDITDISSVSRIPIEANDIVYNVAARMLHPIVKRRDRHNYFFSVDYEGAKNVVDYAMRSGCNQLIQFSTDMVYGRIQTAPPICEDHPREPIGEYADSKRHIEDYCMAQREKGLRVSIFRPRLIIGPSRLGVLTNLFKLIRRSLPIPLIGNGRNHYQMVSVYDCASAAIKTAEKGVVNSEFNLGSANPPKVRDLLANLIESAGSKSVLVSTPAPLVKAVLRVLDRWDLSPLVPEQYEIADANYLISIENTRRLLDWTPKYGDAAMLQQAYDDFVNGRASDTAF